MRRIAVINQKGGVGKTTTTANLGAALAIQGRRVVVVDMDAQANLSLTLGVEAPSEEPTSYSILIGAKSFGECVRVTNVPNLGLVASNLDLSGAELELASALGREYLLRDALRDWESAHRSSEGRAPADYVLFDCPPSLGLLSINALAASNEVLVTLQTEFLALQGMSKLIGVVQLLKKRLNPELAIAGILPCLYDSRLKLEREVLGEIRSYFKNLVFPQPIRSNVKLAEAPSFGKTIFEYAPESHGADDYMRLARELVMREPKDAEWSALPPFDEKAKLASAVTARVPRVIVPPPRKSPASADASPPRPTQAKSSPPPSAAPEAKPTRTPDAKAAEVRRTTSSPTPETKPTAEAKPTRPPSAKPTRAFGAQPTRSAEVVPAQSSESKSSKDPEPKLTPPPTRPSRANADVRPDTKPAETPSAATKRTPRKNAVSAPGLGEPSTRPKPFAERAHGAVTAEKPRETTASASQEKPAPVPAAVFVPRTRSAKRSVRAEDMPQLPPDAFEILHKNDP